MLESIPLEERLRQCEKELKACRENLRICQERLEACQKERDLLLRINQDHARMSAGWTGSTLLSEILLGSDQEHDLEQEPLSIQLEAIQHASEADQDMLVIAWQFAPLGEAESLQSYVQRQTQFDENNPGPTLEGSLVFASKQFLRDRNFCNLQEAGNRVAQWFRGVAILRQEWQAHLKNVRCGDYKPFTFRTVVFGGMNGSSSSVTRAFYNIPAVIVDSRGQRYWGMVRQSLPSSLTYQLHWSMRDLMSLNTTRACMITVSEDTGMPLWQNSASMAMIGVHGIYNRQIFSDAPCDSSERQRSINLHINYIEMLFSSCKEDVERLKMAAKRGETFSTRVEIVHPVLRAWMRLECCREAHHDVFITLSQDPVSLSKVFTVSQHDVTDMVTAQRQTQKALSELALEKDAVQALLQRQYELIACISLVTDVSRSVYSKPLATELIETVRMQIANTSMAERPSRQIERLALLGSGSYGKVYKGRWRDMDVAIKSMMLPYKMSGAEKSHCMAVMEAAISTSLKHPNIVKTHTYSIQPVMEQSNVEHQIDLPTLSPTHHLNTAGAEVQEARVLGLEGSGHNQPPVVRAFHIQMVLEFCDCGTLRSALNQGAFKRELPKDGSLESSCSAANSCLKGLNINYSAVLETAIDIARGMLHLHESNIVHSDLKAQNVLLQSCSNEARGVVAKISDFGLSLQMDGADSHISKMFQGTLTHMAPEVLLHGCQSTASDVYAFGITMWELFTSKLAFSDVPSTLLAYQIAHKGCRPDFPADSPSGYVRLALRCWDHNPAARPDFNIILEELRQLRAQEPEAATLLMMQKDLVVEVGPSSGSYIAELGSPVRGTFIGGSAILLAPADSDDED